MITTLSPFGGPRLAKLFAKIDHLAQLAGGSTHDQVADVVDQLREATAETLASRYNARTLQHDLLGPLGAVKVETLIGELTAVQVKEVVTAVGVERVAAILATNQAGRSETLAKATELFGNVDTLNQVLRRCAAHLHAADTAKFLDESVLRGWKLAAPLETFFALADEHTMKRVKLANTFVEDGNDGLQPDVPGEAHPAKAEHSRTIDGPRGSSPRATWADAAASTEP